MDEQASQCTQIARLPANMGGHSSKSCTFREPAATPPPPVPDLIVTGNGEPSPNGNYFAAHNYGGKTAYRREDGWFWIWYDSEWPQWCLSDTLGQFIRGGWWDPEEDTDPTGNYSPESPATGTAIVSRP